MPAVGNLDGRDTYRCLGVGGPSGHQPTCRARCLRGARRPVRPTERPPRGHTELTERHTTWRTVTGADPITAATSNRHTSTTGIPQLAYPVDQATSSALAPWRKSRAVHDPGKTVLNIAFAIMLGDCLTEVAIQTAEPGVYGRPVATDPMVSRLLATLAAGGNRALPASRKAGAQVHEHVRLLADDTGAARRRAGDLGPGRPPSFRADRCGH